MGWGSPPETPEERVRRLRGSLVGYADAGLFGRLTYTFTGSLLALGKAGGLDEDVGPELLPSKDSADKLAARFDAAYDQVSARFPGAKPSTLMWRTYWALYRWRLLSQMVLQFMMVGVRIGQPLFLRRLVSWFWASQSARDGAGPPVAAGEGWLWAALMALFAYLACLIHHAFFWRGMRNGLYMRLQAMAAVQRKVLRLNGVGVADVTPGKIVNILANDVRRLDEGPTYGLFLLVSPVELVIVLVLIGLRMGFPAALAGVGTSLTLIPLQAALGRRIVRLRARAAALSDERVRLTSEAIGGVLAAKMLVWEPDLLARILDVRSQEHACTRSQARIRGVNMGVAFAITPLAALITLAVARAEGRTLAVANVFYTIALLQLPKLYMADFFVRAVETMSELSVTMRRLGAFLSASEPPARDGAAVAGVAPGTVDIRDQDFDWDVLPWAQSRGEAGKNNDELKRVSSELGKESKTPSSKSLHEGGLVNVVDDVETTAMQQDASAPAPAPHHAHTLTDITLRARPGQLIGIVGEVGAGKSSLLAAVLGELQPLRAAGAPVIVAGALSYVAQIPWVCAGSVRDNITFGSAFDAARYERVLAACALADDLAQLPAGDLTELGERGVNLSGGQKARVTLARAAYSAAAVHVLDDPLSAVDPRVARTLFDECIGPGGVMAGATRLLATHQAQFLAPCDEVLVVRGGRVAERGTLAALRARGVPEAAAAAGAEAALDDGVYDAQAGTDDVEEAFARESGDEEGDDEEEGVKEKTGVSARSGCSTASGGDDVEGHPAQPDVAPKAPPAPELRSRSFAQRAFGRLLPSSWRQHTRADLEAVDEKPSAAAPRGSLITAEERRSGSVGWRVYRAFLGYMGIPSVLVLLIALLGAQAIYIFSDYWIALWSSKDADEQQKAYWIWGYAIMVLTLLVISLARAQLFFVLTLRAASALHEDMISRLLRAPLSFFHTNPAGRVLNRFSKDQGAVDDQLPVVVYDALQAAMQVLGAFVLLMVVVPVVIPVFLPLGIAFVLIYRHYITTSCEVKRFEATTRSPVFASFSAVLKGLPTIRAYAAFDRFRGSFLRDLNANGAWYFVFVTCARWVGIRMDLLVALLMTAAPLLMMGVHDRMSARLVGLALSQSLQLGGVMQWMTRQLAEMENHMTSVERMLEYTRLEQEPATLALGGAPPPEGWPSAGELTLERVTAVYRRGLPPVLRDLSFAVPAGASCGVVGRTGSGKSSLLLALFRLIPVTRGAVRIDGVDAASIALDALRRQIAIIPQDPVLFSGSLRGNLDPWRRFDDARLWEALRAVQLEGPLRALGGLEARMLDGGENLSVGQRQLFCLARALLQGASLLALDEATANVDRATDALIQAAVRDFCRGGGPLSAGRRRTVLIIAHRIHTIMDCDTLLVLSAGRLEESGPPAELARGRGVFAKLVKAAHGNAGQAA